MRFGFYELFRDNGDGSLSSTKPLVIGGGASFASLRIHDFIRRDVEAEELNGIAHIRGFY